MKTLGRQRFSSLVGSPQETRFPADSRSVCQKFVRKVSPPLKAPTRQSGASYAPAPRTFAAPRYRAVVFGTRHLCPPGIA
jgi:hypothetical protein